MRPTFAGFMVIWALLAIGCRNEIKREVLARVLSSNGGITIARANTNAGSASIGDKQLLAVGCHIETAADGKVDIAAVPGTLVRLGPLSDLSIEELKITKDGDAMVDAMTTRSVRLRLTRGVIHAVVDETRTNARLRVNTPTGAVIAQGGCTFYLAVQANQTRLTCVRGTVRLERPNALSLAVVEAGYFQVWPSAADRAVAADSDQRAQEEVTETLETERELLELQRHARNSPKPWR
jgi:FecR protein